MMKWQKRFSMNRIIPRWVKVFVTQIQEILSWSRRSFEAPSPSFIKRSVLIRNGSHGATWVETGTYRGETTRILARNAPVVYTIEPSQRYFEIAKRRLRRYKNVFVIKGTSEESLPNVLEKISGDVNFWLDGHYSGGETFQATRNTPIVSEMAVIEKKLRSFGKVVVIIDDLRCFGSTNPDYLGYPSIDFLIQWAIKMELNWKMEHDMFIAKNFID